MHYEIVVKRRMPVEKLVYLLAAAPAMIFGHYPRKGTIDVGGDADLILFDPRIRKQIRNEDLHQGTDQITRYLKDGGPGFCQDDACPWQGSGGRWNLGWTGLRRGMAEKTNSPRYHRRPGYVSHDFG